MSWESLVVHASVSTVIVLGLAFVWGKSWVLPYLTAKAQKLAEKEDIAEITSAIENIKAQHTKDIEGLKSSLDRKNTIHRIQFEAEFQIYRETQNLAHDVLVAYVRAFRHENFPEGVFRDDPGGYMGAFLTAQLAFTSFLQRNEPFFQRKVFNRFNSLEELVLDQKVRTANHIPQTPEQRQADRAAINRAFLECTKAIRNRLSTILVE